MNARLRRWESATDGTFGQEFISRPLLPGALAVALRPILWDLVDGAFLMARIGPSDHAGVCAAIRAIDELRSGVRVSLLIDLATLDSLERELPQTDAVGLVLDGVTAATPLSSFILDSIEAVRFDESFTAAASHNLRIEAVLRAMLLVANDMALGTFASSLSGPGTALEFDYVARTAETQAEVRVFSGGAQRQGGVT